jgi:hypothetical protein
VQQELVRFVQRINKLIVKQKGMENLQEAYLSVYQELDEAMSSYERNRMRAAQRAAARNEARKKGLTGNVPGVGYVSPRPERETWTDESGKKRHKTGARMPENQNEEVDQLDEIGNPISRFLSNRKHKRRDTPEGHQEIMDRNREYQTKGKGPGGYRNKGAGRIEDTRKEEVDLFDYLLEYLVAEGYADTNENAIAIMANMSEEWKQSIVEADSIEAMRARAAKRRKQRYGSSDTSRGGRDDFRPYTEDDYKNPKPGYGSGPANQAKGA